MGVYIKGMEMPKEISSNSHRTITLVIGSDGLVYNVNGNRLPAVAVEVPEPHGRLIDADEYQKKICTYNETGCGSCEYQTKCPADAPTVIEAEGEEK